MADVACLYHDPCEIPWGYCHCGCGQRTELILHDNLKAGRRKGDPSQFLRGHVARVQYAKLRVEYAKYFDDPSLCRFCDDAGVACPVGAGYCHCGCGQKTNVPAWRNHSYNIPGLPVRYRRGHNSSGRVGAAQAEQMRRDYLDDTTLTVKAIARRYGVSQSYASDILNFKAYQEVGVAPGGVHNE